ncbi:MAG: hypothetical protein M3Z08_09910 [Chloroflexota bacterium]|nr:hypothetical protein [Chloroflexota bacterium]
MSVDKLNAHTEFQGMNLSRVLMIMLARETLRHASAQRISSKRFVLGLASDVTNLDFWRLYSTNAETLLRRGDHQVIDLPQNPLQKG